MDEVDEVDEVELAVGAGVVGAGLEKYKLSAASTLLFDLCNKFSMVATGTSPKIACMEETLATSRSRFDMLVSVSIKEEI